MDQPSVSATSVSPVAPSSTSAASSSSSGNTALFIAEIPLEVTEAEFRSTFSSEPGYVSARLRRDRNEKYYLLPFHPTDTAFPHHGGVVWSTTAPWGSLSSATTSRPRKRVSSSTTSSSPTTMTTASVKRFPFSRRRLFFSQLTFRLALLCSDPLCP